MLEGIGILYSVLMPILLMFYGFFFFKVLQRKRKHGIYKGFFRAVNSIVNNSEDLNKGINEIKLNFRKLAEKNPSHKEIIRNPTDLMEELIYNVDNFETKNFKEKFGFEITNETRAKILEFITKLKVENPYVSLPPKEGNLLSLIQQSLETNNKEMGLNALSQLAEEIEILDTNIRVQEKRNVNAYIVSVVGVLLTVIFGILTLIQFLGDK